MSTRGTRKPSTRKTTKSVDKDVVKEVKEVVKDVIKEVEEVVDEKPVAPQPVIPQTLIHPSPTPSPQVIKSDEDKTDEIPAKAPLLKFDDVFTEKKIQPNSSKSITEFDYDEIRKIDVGDIKKMDNITLMKILVVRGRDSGNSAIWQAMLRLLKQVNCEFDPLREPRFEQRSNNNFPRRDFPPRPQFDIQRTPFNGGRGGYGSRGRGRGGFVPQVPPQQPRDYQRDDDL